MSDEQPKSDQFPAAWLHEAIRDLRQSNSEQHQRLRQDFQEFTQELRNEQRERMTMMRSTEHRVTVIETQRADEATATVRRGVMSGMLAAAGLTALWETVKHKLNW